jgi:apolipoprotein N-acyltransferase
VALLQGNVPQDEKFQPGTGVPMALRWYGEQLRDARAALVVAPETAVPMLPQQLPAGYWRCVAAALCHRQPGRAGGHPAGQLQADGYTNSVIGLKPGALVYRFDKHHLVPFGEFIPAVVQVVHRLDEHPAG